MVEKTGRSADIALTMFTGIKAAAECNIIEREDEAIPFEGNKIQLNIKPFEIKTLKLKLK